MYCLQLQGLISPRLKIHSECHNPMTSSQSITPTDNQIRSYATAKRPRNSGSTFLLSLTRSCKFKKDHNLLFGNDIGANVFGMQNYNIYVHKISVILIYMIKYSSLQLLCKPFVCWIGTTSARKKEYTSSPKPHSKRVIPK